MTCVTYMVDSVPVNPMLSDETVIDVLLVTSTSLTARVSHYLQIFTNKHLLTIGYSPPTGSMVDDLTAHLDATGSQVTRLKCPMASLLIHVLQLNSFDYKL